MNERNEPEPTDPERTRALATLGLGLSALAAAVAVGYFWLREEPLVGVALGALLVVAGLWEYYQKLAEVRTAVQAERDE